MIVPRIITRTHYQIDEPAYLRALTLRCASPVRSGFKDRVAGCLSDVLRANQINTAAAGYAVDLGRLSGLLTENLVWTKSAHVLNLITTVNDSVELSTRERLFFFKVFLESDGAALLFLLSRAVRCGALPDGQTWSELANELVTTVFSEYFQRAADPPERARIRQIVMRRKDAPYTGKSGPHQVFPHLQILYRLDLLERRDAEGQRRYLCRDRYLQRSRRFLEEIPDTKALDTIVATHRWAEIAALTITEPVSPVTRDFTSALPSLYRRVMETGVALCPIETLIEAYRIQVLADRQMLFAFDDLLQEMKQLQRNYPRRVRFHVDRAGIPTYIKIDRHLEFS